MNFITNNRKKLYECIRPRHAAWHKIEAKIIHAIFLSKWSSLNCISPQYLCNAPHCEIIIFWTMWLWLFSGWNDGTQSSWSNRQCFSIFLAFLCKSLRLSSHVQDLDCKGNILKIRKTVSKTRLPTSYFGKTNTGQWPLFFYVSFGFVSISNVIYIEFCKHLWLMMLVWCLVLLERMWYLLTLPFIHLVNRRFIFFY